MPCAVKVALVPTQASLLSDLLLRDSLPQGCGARARLVGLGFTLPINFQSPLLTAQVFAHPNEGLHEHWRPWHH